MTSHSKQYLILYSILICAVIFFSMFVYSKTMPFRVVIKEGDIALRTIVSPVYLEFETSQNKKENTELIDQATQEVSHIFVVSQEINDSILESISSVYQSFLNTAEPPLNLPYLSSDDKTYLESLSTSNLLALEGGTIHITTKLIKNGIKAADIPNLDDDINRYIYESGFDSKVAHLINVIILNNLTENLIFDKTKTKQELEFAISELPLKQTILKEGEPIIYKGEQVTPSHIEIFKKLNLYGSYRNISKFLGILCVISFLFLLIERFIYHFNQRIYRQYKSFILIFVLISLTLFSASLLISINPSYPYLNLLFLIPIPMATIILGLLLTSNLSILIGTVSSIIIALLYSNKLDVFLFLFFANCIATFATYRKYLRSELIQSGYIIGGFNVGFIIAIGLLRDIHDLSWYGFNSMLGMANGILSVMIALAILPYLETLFQLTTSQTLLELTNQNHPLLKQLMTVAPGTYQHSIMVANLAEAAANKIKANPVICRVSAYFHDIGKLKRPGFFIENQVGANPHEKLSPIISAMIISAHVKDGLDMAKSYKLPKVVKDIIAQHHGTSLVSFFYTQACIEGQKNNTIPDISTFRYPGPKPKFKEAGIMMLADSVEAAVRSIDKPSITKIETLINKVMSDKLQDFQLEECPLSLKEMGQIKKAFIDVYKGIYHTRLDYDKEIESILNQSKST